MDDDSRAHQGHATHRPAEPTSPTDEHRAHGGASGESGRALPPALRPTRPQLVVWSVASMLALIVGILYSAYRVNLGLGARDVGGAVMPPGMVMTRDTPGEAMREMAAVDPDESISRRRSRPAARNCWSPGSRAVSRCSTSTSR